MPSSDIHGVIVVGARNVVHTFGCPTAFDVAWCAETVGEDDEQMLEVRRTARLGARRVALPHLVRGVTVVAPCGSFERWRLHVGDRLEIT